MHALNSHQCHTNLMRACLAAGILLPVVVPPIRERFYKPEVKNPPPFKQARSPHGVLAAARPIAYVSLMQRSTPSSTTDHAWLPG